MFPGVENEYQAIGQALANLAPDGWARAWITAKVGDTLSEPEFDYAAADGSEDWLDPDVETIAIVGRSLRAIRKAMIASGQEPWTYCTFTLTPDGDFSLDIDYDRKPEPGTTA